MAKVATDDKCYGKCVSCLPSLSGKCVAVTGTTSGTGYWCAVAAIRAGATCVLLLNRPSVRAEKALDALTKEVKATASSSSLRQVDCDLQSFASVRAAAAVVVEESAQRCGGLDALVCNAGVMAVPDSRTGDSLDVQMQTNHLSHFLLTKLLMPSLEAAAAARGEARVVQHSSGARKPNNRRPGSDDLEEAFFLPCAAGTLGGDKGACFLRYHMSKLANTAFAMALHTRLATKGSKVKSVAAEPGVAATDLQANTARHHTCCMKCVFKCIGCCLKCTGKQHMQTAADGSCSLVVAAFDARTESGDLWMPSKMVPGKKFSVHGEPVKSVERGQANSMVPAWITEKFESEALTLSPKNQATVWEASEKAIGETWAI